MELHKFDADQVKRICKMLHACGIEPTAQTMQALVETAEAHYPGDPAGLEKAAQSLVAFFEGSATARPKQERSWHRLRSWAFSVLRL
jgi:hypothetical protein